MLGIQKLQWLVWPNGDEECWLSYLDIPAWRSRKQSPAQWTNHTTVSPPQRWVRNGLRYQLLRNFAGWTRSWITMTLAKLFHSPATSSESPVSYPCRRCLTASHQFVSCWNPENWVENISAWPFKFCLPQLLLSREICHRYFSPAWMEKEDTTKLLKDQSLWYGDFAGFAWHKCIVLGLCSWSDRSGTNFYNTTMQLSHNILNEINKKAKQTTSRKFTSLDIVYSRDFYRFAWRWGVFVVFWFQSVEGLLCATFTDHTF